ncbi:hypothetical protein DUNSADRAFT_3098 [Dunaliella salina]|uniref:Uncharacterized protein n=1 Tax=Dunaliella salina TaxID=3046 RepID=A0ABQ7GUL6_DUNSA|nr:hypothetical protein DUNSADRAFT_3098 [Dunaliella salina]|eukprot:KAF5838302.1 hypothetical protein DUNSADRAFT_3098 [Dunaliella salina]
MQTLKHSAEGVCVRTEALNPVLGVRARRARHHRGFVHQQPQQLCFHAADVSCGSRAQGGADPSMFPQASMTERIHRLKQHAPPPSEPDWTAPQLLRALGAFLLSCLHLLPKLSIPSLPDALKRLGLILVASMLMIVVLTSIDSTCLWLYVTNARRLA